ncbi:MAG: TolB family protein, partial [Gaiellaceae bacterium]
LKVCGASGCQTSTDAEQLRQWEPESNVNPDSVSFTNPQAYYTIELGFAEPARASLLAATRLVAGNPPRLAIVTLAPDGSGIRAVVEAPTNDGALVRVDAPVWVPAGDRILFTGVTAEREDGRVGEEGTFSYYESDIFSITPDGSGRERLTATHDAGGAVPSPDGATILFARREHQDRFPPTSGLWLMDADGNRARRLLEVRDGQLDFPGGWSPDGERIVFTRCRWTPPGPGGRTPNSCAVYTVAPDGEDLKRLADRARGGFFSPDGKRILFVSDRDEHGLHQTGSDEEDFANELYVMEADGDHQQRLTETEGLDEQAHAWSPDGRLIAYARAGPNRFSTQLMLMRADGSCPTRIAGDAASADQMSIPDFRSPSWRGGRVAEVTLDCS